MKTTTKNNLNIYRERVKAMQLCEATNLAIQKLQTELSMMKVDFLSDVTYALECQRELPSPLTANDLIQLIKKPRGFRPFPTSSPKGPALSQLFFSRKQGAKLTFEDFTSELQRHGYLYDRELYLTGREIRTLYQFLLKQKFIRPLPNMVAVYRAFKANFTLQIKSASSLQRIRDNDKEINAWKNVFLRTENR